MLFRKTEQLWGDKKRKAVWYSTYEDYDTEDDSPEGGILAGVSILALFFLVWAFNRTHMSDWFQNHLVQFIAFAVGYIGVSPLWGFTKWYFFVRARKRRRDQGSADFWKDFPNRIKRARDTRERDQLENEKENEYFFQQFSATGTIPV